MKDFNAANFPRSAQFDNFLKNATPVSFVHRNGRCHPHGTDIIHSSKISLLWFAESRVDIKWFDSGVGTRMFNIAMKTRAWEYPSDNLYKDAITRRLDRQVHNAHRKRIKESQCMVDCHPPSTCGVRQLRHFAKKRQLKEGRELQIFSENSRHVDKLAQIINRQSGFCSSSSSIGGNMNNHHPPMKGDALFCKRSSIESARKKESERIAKDNQLLKDR